MATKNDLKLFLSEAKDLLQKVEDNILKLEEKPEDSSPIQELYFAFHTLKGHTAMIGLANVSKLCHDNEALLDKAKHSSLSRSKASLLIDSILESVDIGFELFIKLVKSA